MLRVLGISFGIIVGLILLLIAGLWALLKTPYGIGVVDDVSRPIIEQTVQDRLGADVSYGPLIGPLPGQLVIQDLALATDGDVWFESERIIFAWNLWTLLRGELSIETIIVDTSRLERLPTLPEQADEEEEQDEDDNAERSRIPFDISLGDLIIDDFTLGPDILGAEHTFSLQSSARLLRPRLRLSLHAQTAGGADEVFISGDIDQQGADVDLVLVSEPEGAVALAAQTEDRLEVRLRVMGRYGEMQTELGAAMGQYGQLMGTASRDGDQNNALHTDLVYTPGSILPSEVHTLLGDQLHIVADIVERRGGADLELQTFSGDFGALAGMIGTDWQNRRALRLDLEGALSEHIFDSFGAGSFAGGVDLKGAVEETGDGYAMAGTLNAGSLSLSLADGISNEDILFGGNVSLAVSSVMGLTDALAPFLAEGGRAQSAVVLTGAQILSLEGLEAVLGSQDDQRLFVNGSADVDLLALAMNSEISVTAEAGLLDVLLDDVTTQGDLVATVTAAGSADDLALSIEGSVPGGFVRGTEVSPGALNIALTGLPNQPSGSVSLIAEEAYALETIIASTEEFLSIESLDARFGELTLTGAGQFNPETGQGAGSLNFDATERTRLITGQIVSGQLAAEFSNRPDESSVHVALRADDLRFDQHAIGSLAINANGPPEAVSYTLAALDVASQDLFLHSAISTGVVALNDEREAAIETFVVRLSDDDRNPQEISLVRPTTASWGKGISLAPTRIAWLNNGIVTANADISQDTWVIQLAAQRIGVPGTDTFVSAQLNVDTRDTDPASFQIVAATEGKNDRYAVRADGRWTGQEVLTEGIIIRSGRERLGSFEAKTPLVLTRAPALAVEVPDAPISASLDYDDTFAPILAFFPSKGTPATGLLQAKLMVEGPMGEPAVSGAITLSETRLEDPEIGITVVGLAGDITFEGQGRTIAADVNLTGSGREGREGAVRLSGSIDATAERSRLDLKFVTDRAQLARNAELELRVTSDLSLTGSFEEVTLAGPITINEFDFAIPDTEASDNAPTYVPVNIVRTDIPEEIQTVAQLDEDEALNVIINLDLDVEARNGVFIRGRGLESEWAIDLGVEGTADDPKLRGTVSSIDGTLDLAGRSFSLTEGLVSFTPETSLDPTLDVRAETITGIAPDEITAIARVTGPSSQPTIRFTSNPSLPEEDVLALILFGRPATDLGAAEALQLAQAAATLSGTGPFGGAGLGNGLRSGLGLDRLTFDPEGRSLTVGKYIADDVYVSAVQGIGELGTAFSVVYEVSRFFSLETTLKSNGAQSLSGTYRRDY